MKKLYNSGEVLHVMKTRYATLVKMVGTEKWHLEDSEGSSLFWVDRNAASFIIIEKLVVKMSETYGIRS